MVLNTFSLFILLAPLVVLGINFDFSSTEEACIYKNLKKGQNFHGNFVVSGEKESNFLFRVTNASAPSFPTSLSRLKAIPDI